MGFVASGLWWFVAVGFFFGFRWWRLVVARCGCGFARLRAFVHPNPFV